MGATPSPSSNSYYHAVLALLNYNVLICMMMATSPMNWPADHEIPRVIVYSVHAYLSLVYMITCRALA